ncbi:MAG: carbohydrate ABC transporter permease [Anaerolineae bacterium]|nr:carbohydrate ABC transporter permease [Anaerolineae bacterium]
MFKNQRAQSNIPNYIILSLLALFALVPIAILFLNSLKTTVEIGRNPIGLPEEIRWENYSEAWKEGGYAITIRNSVLMMSLTIVGSLTIAGFAAYALARLKLRGASLIAFYFLVGTSVPPQLFMVPLFVMWRQIGLINTHLGLIIIYCGLYSPFATYLLRSYMVSLPEEFIEAARIDGANNLQVFRRIILPLSWPGFLTAGLVIGLNVWNEFLFAVTFLPDPSLKPVATSLFEFQGRFSRDWGLTSAGSVIMVIPIIVLFLLLQRRFIEGLTQGGLKG